MATRKTPPTLLTSATRVSPSTLKWLRQRLEDTREERAQQLEGPQPGTAKWQRWRAIPSVPLWKAVMLSLDIEPEPWMTHDVQMHDGLHRQLGDSKLPAQFWAKLAMCRANVNPSGLIRPIKAGDSIVFGEVLLADVAAFLARYGLPMPDEMRALVPGAAQTAVGDRWASAPAPVEPDAAASPASAARVVRNSTKGQRDDDLWRAIREAQRRCTEQRSDPWSTADVWPVLLTLAEEEFEPLLGVPDPKTIKHRGGTLTRKALNERLKGRKPGRGKAG